MCIGIVMVGDMFFIWCGCVLLGRLWLLFMLGGKWGL